MISFLVTIASSLIMASSSNASQVASHLPNELSAEDVLNGKYPFPPSPKIEYQNLTDGFNSKRLGTLPQAGVHPRVLFGVDDIPTIRERIGNTHAGQEILKKIRERINNVILRSDGWEKDFYQALSSGDIAKSKEIWLQKNRPNSRSGHYQPYFLYELVLHSLDNLLFENQEAGKKSATAIATYAAMIEEALDKNLTAPLNDDVWRINVENTPSIRDLMGYHLVGLGYDFNYNFMSDAERETVRRVISKATKGKLFMGARLPKHFRNWNWCAVGLSQSLLALAIEGENGYDERVYQLGADILRDYLTYGISPKGSSTEAVGYTQFGLVWLMPFSVAAARRGDNFLTHEHYRNMLNWYVASTEPFGAKWTSHGDGGDGGPSLETLLMWRYFFPQDQRVEFLFDNLVKAKNGNPFNQMYHAIEALLFASDAEVKNPETFSELIFFDPQRGSLNARTSFDKTAAFVTFESRIDSVAASHEHADRGNFTFSALGKNWAKENFRSVATEFHNNVVVDSVGQGYWPGPGKFLGMEIVKNGIIASADLGDNYRYFWPKSILADDLENSPRFSHLRWAGYLKEAKEFQARYNQLEHEKDSSPSVRKHFENYEFSNPRMWDEDGVPTRYKFSDFEYAYRTIYFNNSLNPYLLIVDDIKKDKQPHLYQWLMQCGLDKIAVNSFNGNELILADINDGKFDKNGKFTPRANAPLLLVVSINNIDKLATRRHAVVMALESFERKDPIDLGGRSFGLDKRLVINKLQNEGDFRVLLIPYYNNQAKPQVKFEQSTGELQIQFADKSTSKLKLTPTKEHRTSISF